MAWRSLCVLALITIAQAVARADEFPYTAYVNSDDVYVRSGPGRNYYPTAELCVPRWARKLQQDKTAELVRVYQRLSAIYRDNEDRMAPMMGECDQGLYSMESVMMQLHGAMNRFART